MEFNDIIDDMRRINTKYPHTSKPDMHYLNYDSVLELKGLIEKRENERKINNVLKGEPDLLVSLLDIFNTGYQGSIAIPEAVIKPHFKFLGKGLIPDWFLIGKNSDGYQYIIVELKSPAEKIFYETSGGLQFSAYCNRAMNQLLNYLTYAERNQAFLRDEFRLGGLSNLKGLLVIGNRDDLTEKMSDQKRAWNETLSKKMTIVTWDRVKESLIEKWNFIRPDYKI